MAGNKLKLLYLADILKRYSDEEHIITMSEILSKLGEYGIVAERKSIYSDIETLRAYGLEIEMRKNPTGYFLASDRFELPELKLLVDAVQTSKFLSKKKSSELIKKLEECTSTYQAKELRRQVYVADRIKTSNESIYYNVDKLHRAITTKVQIKFIYLEWNTSKKLVQRKEGKTYAVSPISLVWSDENYYLVGLDEDSDIIKHYRVDKMKNIEVTEIAKTAGEETKEINLAMFSRKTFGMYGGEEETLDIIFPDRLAGVVIDRFGSDIPLIPGKDGTFKARIKVTISQQFYGWLAGLGGGVRIVSPEEETAKYKEYLQKLLEDY